MDGGLAYRPAGSAPPEAVRVSTSDWGVAMIKDFWVVCLGSMRSITSKVWTSSKPRLIER